MRKLAAGFLFALWIAPALAQAPPVVPALPDTERRTTYSITASPATLNVGFDLYGDGTDYGQWVEVWHNGVQLTATTDFTVTSPSGSLSTRPRPIQNAQVNLLTSRTGTIEIVGARRPRRTSQFSENRGVAARDLNQVITDLVAITRERWDRFIRQIRVAPGDSLTTLPGVTSRANNLLGFDSTGQPFLYAPGAGYGTVIAQGNITPGNVAVFGTSSNIILDGGPVLSGGRRVDTTAPLQGGGDLSANRTLTLSAGDGLTVNSNSLILASPSTVKLGGVFAKASVASRYVIAVTPTGAVLTLQPQCGELSDAAPSCAIDATNAANISTGSFPAARVGAISLTAGNVPGGVVGALPVLNGGTGTAAATSAAALAGIGGLNLSTKGQNFGGGATVSAYALGSAAFTVDCGLGPLQYATNNATPFVITRPTADGSCIVLFTNGAGAGAYTMSGFTASGTSTGDTISTTNTFKYSIHFWRINGTSSFLVSAHQ